MRQPKLRYSFHNPNPPDKSADYILRILIDTNAPKVNAEIIKLTEKSSIKT